MTNDAPTLGMRPIHTLLRDLAARDMRLHSLLVHQHGRTVLDLWQWPHEPGLKHKTHSVTKSFTGTAVGFAEAEGLLRLDDPVVSFFPGRLSGPPEENLSRMRVRDLLTMQTGHGRGLSGATTRLRAKGWVEEFLDEPLRESPGRHFQYSSTTSHVLSAIVQHVSGVPVDEYLRPRLFEPLGITDYEWEHDPEGVASGGNGLSLRPRDLLSFGILHLQDGWWQGHRLLPGGWPQKASALHVLKAVSGQWNGSGLVPPAPDAVADSGYGYQFWTTDDGIYNASGIFGQECMVFPRQQGVVVVTGAMGDGTYHDLPGMLRTAFREAFRGPSADREAETAATRQVQEWTGRVRQPRRTDPAPHPYRVGLRESYTFEPNEQGLSSLGVHVRENSVLLDIEDERGRHTIEHGFGDVISQRTDVSTWRLHHSYQEESALVLAGAQWSAEDAGEYAEDPDTLVLTWDFAEGPFTDLLSLRFRDGSVDVQHSVNVNSGPTTLRACRGVCSR